MEGAPQSRKDIEATDLARRREAFNAGLDPAKVGDPMYDRAVDLQRLVTGLWTVEEIGEPYFRSPEGTLGIHITLPES